MSGELSDPNFAELVDAHYRGLRWFALALTRNPADASDLVQQTFLRWATKSCALRNPGGAKAWLYQTLHREFLRQRRRRGREEPLPAELPNDEPEANAPAQVDVTAVLEALQRLPPEYRSVVALFYLQQHTYREISDILELPIGTVMSRLARGKAELRRALLDRPSITEPRQSSVGAPLAKEGFNER